MPDNFLIRRHKCDEKTGIVQFAFSFDNETEFTETIDFGAPLPAKSSAARNAFEKALEQLRIALGISYYKAFVPTLISIEKPHTSTETLEFFKNFYFHGLGEFACRNKLDLRGHFQFQGIDPEKTIDNNQAVVTLPRRCAVLLGGGKDSLVSLEILRLAREPLVLFAVNPAKPIRDCARQSGLPLITINRKISENLFSLNEKGAYNGHIPITGIISFIAVAAAFIHDFDNIILSNERSANEGNQEYLGTVVNHQYSKSFVFEKSFAQHIRKTIAQNLNYFSLLRPLSELRIAQAFAKSDRYDNVFTSCNSAFKLREPTHNRWCLNCPKCRFVFLALATAIPRERLLSIFGSDMLDDPNQLQGYRELVGLQNHKPWECVGETLECAAAMHALTQEPDWNRDFIPNSVLPELQRSEDSLDEIYIEALTPASEHNIPEHYLRMLNDYLEER